MNNLVQQMNNSFKWFEPTQGVDIAAQVLNPMTGEIDICKALRVICIKLYIKVENYYYRDVFPVLHEEDICLVHNKQLNWRQEIILMLVLSEMDGKENDSHDS